MTRISENQLVLPSLYLMHLQPNWYITTSKLKRILPEIMKPTWEDLKISKTRPGETKFIQIIWNLKSHKTFLKNWLAEEVEWWFKITKEGKQYLKKNKEVIEYLLENNFKWDDIKKELNKISEEPNKKVQIFNEKNDFILEWSSITKKTKTYTRSKKLREFAVNHFKREDWKIYCEACNFCYDLFYWKKLSKNYIEIHHKKPVFKYEWEDLEKSLKKALKNLSPVCANCHRIIHRNKTKILEIEELIKNIEKNWILKNP